MYTDKHVFAKMLHDHGKIEDVCYQIYLNWFYEFAKDYPINGSVSIEQMCSAIKQTFQNQSDMPGSIKAAYNDSCTTNTSYQIPQFIRNNNLFRIMTSRLNLDL